MAAKNITLLVVAGMAVSLTACDKYMDRRDTVTFGSGDAVAFNKAAQIIDPWPAAARTIEHGMSGEQAEAAMEGMRRRSKGDGAGGGVALPPSQTQNAAPKLQ
ncbi:MAG: hypothetical protein ACRCWF_06960 [Beijerinckiaceae bacterium]